MVALSHLGVGQPPGNTACLWEKLHCIENGVVGTVALNWQAQAVTDEKVPGLVPGKAISKLTCNEDLSHLGLRVWDFSDLDSHAFRLFRRSRFGVWGLRWELPLMRRRIWMSAA